jgi:hypothetical protein
LKRGLRRAGWAIGTFATLASVAYILHSWRGQDLSTFASWRAGTAVAICTAFYLVGVIATAWAWKRLLSDLDVRKPWRVLASILAVTQVGKYLPGNVAQHVGRASLAFDRGIAPIAFGVTLACEMLLLMLASVLVGVSALLVSGRSLAVLPGGRGESLVLVVALVALAIAGLVLASRLAPRLVTRFAPTLAGRLAGARMPSLPALGAAFSIYSLVYLVFGAGIVLMARRLLPDVPQDAWLLVAAFALAWIIGFVTPGAPAGLGMREGVMLLMLGTHYPPAASGAIVVGLRLATTLGDILLFPLGLLLARKPPA